MKLEKKHKRLLAYTAILGGAAILSVTFFAISQFEKAKWYAADSVRRMSVGKYNDYIAEDENALTDEGSKYHNAAVYWKEVSDHFTYVTDVNSAAYQGTAVPAYVFSMATLVAFGLILKHAEKAKEKEDEEAVLGQRKEAV